MSRRGETAARDEQERALLVSAETAMLAKAGAVLRFERVAHDVAVARHGMIVGAVVGPQCQGDLERRIGRQADPGKSAADKSAADPILGLQKSRHPSDEV